MSWKGWLWDFALLFGCGYVVFGLHRSPWWFLLMCVLLCTPGEEEKKDGQ